MVTARSSNLLGKITILLMVSFVVNTATALDGSGTEEDPWRIKSLDDFNDFAADANYWDDYTRLETDVNLAGMVYERAVIAPDVINTNYYFDGTAFTGVFDGNDHKTVNLIINDGGAGNDHLGLFGYINGGEVRNLGLENGSVRGDKNVGGLVGINQGSVSDCNSSGVVSGDWVVGGLVGENKHGGNISNCYSSGIVSGRVTVGGLVGVNTETITNCYSNVSVSGTGASVGGLVGVNGGSVSKCYSTGDVRGTGANVGGLVGENSDSVSNCYSTSSVEGDQFVGGLVGNNGVSVSKCYSTGDVNGVEYVGGLLGLNGRVDALNCFWDTDTQTHGVIESIGVDYSTATNVVGLPTSQLHQQSTFTDWDFINVWDIGENQTYPYLRVYLTGDINKDGIVNFLDVAITANQWMEEK